MVRRGLKRLQVLTALALTALASTHFTARPHRLLSHTHHHGGGGGRLDDTSYAVPAVDRGAPHSSRLIGLPTRLARHDADVGRVELGEDGFPLDEEMGWDDGGSEVTRGVGARGRSQRRGQRRSNATGSFNGTAGDVDEDDGDDYGEALRLAKLRGAYYNCAANKTEKPGLNPELVNPPALKDPNMLFVNRANHELLLRGANVLPQRMIKALPRTSAAITGKHNWRSCAVVGNSGALRFAEMGLAIDSHDVVMRLNQAPAQQYGRFVGYRTTFRLLNNLWAAHYANRAVQMQLPVEPGVTFILTRAGGKDAQAHAMKMRRQEECMHINNGVAAPMPPGMRCDGASGPGDEGRGRGRRGGGGVGGAARAVAAAAAAKLRDAKERAARIKAEAAGVAGENGGVSGAFTPEAVQRGGGGAGGTRGNDTSARGAVIDWSAVAGFDRRRRKLTHASDGAGGGEEDKIAIDGAAGSSGGVEQTGGNASSARSVPASDADDDDGGFKNPKALFHTALLSSRVVSAARRLLVDYRVGLCRAGYGPFTGGSTPSSGYVAIYLLARMCQRVVVYGFGSVKAYGVQSPYHYFTGKGARFKGNSVHSFGTEERVIAELIASQSHVKECLFRNPQTADPAESMRNVEHNKLCGWNEFLKQPKGAVKLAILRNTRLGWDELAHSMGVEQPR